MCCFKCHRYGHGSERCRRQEAICARSGRTGHKVEECPNDPCCINCGGDHAASDRNCPKFQEEKAILNYRAHHGGTFQQARAAVVIEVTREVQARSFATVVRKGPTKLGGPQAKKSIQMAPAPAKAAPPRERLVGETTKKHSKKQRNSRESSNGMFRYPARRAFGANRFYLGVTDRKNPSCGPDDLPSPLALSSFAPFRGPR
ncbi:nucleic-acid-binding protein from mobile element jockey [Elysia marginata]|uniref:Nucleic-acid-binding protein from mobile element jockey n=1 Tax=Elysia marginata TaxID=1093978 RepID=A0AAV4K199_9GAST|nr:nucleic-acid-binding protein from mobile element jockey [Elysia marginata]